MANIPHAARNLALAAMMSLLTPLVPPAASAGRLSDGTPVRVRLLHPINSETSQNGQPLEFAVMDDVATGDARMIQRGALVGGVIVDVRRARWKFSGHRHAKLAIKFYQTTGCNGQVISLRASSARQSDDRVLIDPSGWNHQVLWAGEANTFVAYVSGNYEC